MSPTRFSRSAHGFTLIEMLLAAALFLAAAATITVFMSQGIRLFPKLLAVGQEEEAAICATKMARDLRNMVFYTLIPFKGGEDQISFASLEDLAGAEGQADPWPIEVTYRYEADKARIVREAIRPQTFERGVQAKTETVLSGARLLTFKYEGEPEEIPRHVTVRIEYQGRFGLRTIVQEVLVPSAPVPTEEA